MNRIRLLRLSRGLTQQQLVQAMGGVITKQALSKYENDLANPSPDVASRLALALDVKTVSLFSAPRFDVRFVAYRSHRGLGIRTRSRLQGLLADQLSARLELQERLGIPGGSPLRPTPVQSLDEAEQSADDLRNSWRLGDVPVGNLTDVLERHRLHVIRVVDAPHQFHGVAAFAFDASGATCGAGVAYSDGSSGERQRLTLAHELGHLALDPKGTVDSEKAAYRFGASLLMPAIGLREAVGRRRSTISISELRLLKQHFGVSMQALVYRAGELGIISAHARTELFISLSRLGWRRNEPDPLPSEQPTLWRQLLARARAEGAVGKDDARRWGLEEAALQAEGDSADFGDPRRLAKLPKDERDRILAAQAEAALGSYAPGSPLVEWAEDFVEGELVERP